jgi:UDP-glucose 4-epimerase
MAVIWITGAHGFIGRHLASHLSGKGHRVYGIGHGVWPELDALQWGVDGWVNGEINATNLESMHSVTGPPERLFHLAGGSTVGGSFRNPLEDFSRTVTTTARLLDWISMHAPDCRTVAVSSAAVYGDRYEGKIPETAHSDPYSPYGHHKLMMEQLCRAYTANFGLQVVIVRLFSVYGSWLQKQLLWDLCSRIASSADRILLGGTGEERRDWTDARDVARLLEVAGECSDKKVGVINGGTGMSTTVRQVAELVIEAWGSSIPLEYSGVSRPGDPFSLVSDPRRLEELVFSWEVDVADGIRSYVHWFRKYWSGLSDE